jgi:formylglycine-generating enzyme required for sulfatase activity
MVGGQPVLSTRFLPLVSTFHPLMPSKPYPANGATGQSPNVFLTWELATTPVDPSVRYAILLEAYNASPTMLLAEGLARPAYDPFTFEPDTQYYWRVLVTTAQGEWITGPVWTFRTEPHYDPPLIGTMVTVPAGEFWMGCDPTVDNCLLAREQPLHRVYLDAYEIDKYEVTNMEYRACVEANVCNPPRRFDAPQRSSYFGNPTYDYYPVMYVSKFDGDAYCGWLGKRLPTEAEWEKAARGPIDTRPWPWGLDGVSCSWSNYYSGCRLGATRVGSYYRSASPYGAYDMAGNLFEWVSDKFNIHYYSVSPYANPTGPELSHMEGDDGPIRSSLYYFTIRGGSSYDNWWYARVTHRHWGHHGDRPNGDSPYFRSFRVGIRCARSLDGE